MKKDCFNCKYSQLCHYKIIFGKMIGENPVIFKPTVHKSDGYWVSFHEWLANNCNSYIPLIGTPLEGEKTV